MVYIVSSEGAIYAPGNLPEAILVADVTLPGVPSQSSVEHSKANAGDVVSTTGLEKEREDQVWVEVTIGDVTGCIPQDAIDPATWPPEGEIEYVYIPE